MVIGVEELMVKIKEKDAKKVEALEERIDNALVKTFDGGFVSIVINGDLPRLNVREELFNKYREQGWEIKYESDQRDGQYISMHPKKTSKTYCEGASYVGPYGNGVSQFDR